MSSYCKYSDQPQALAHYFQKTALLFGGKHVLFSGTIQKSQSELELFSEKFGGAFL